MRNTRQEQLSPELVGRVEQCVRACLARHGDRAASDIDPSRKFSAYGLDSMKTVALASELSELVGRRISAPYLYAHPTLERLLAALVGGTVDSFQPVVGREREPIAVVGMACRFPGAVDLSGYWELLREGRTSIAEVPADRWSQPELYHTDRNAPGRSYIRYGGFLDDISGFDPACFDVSPREARDMDPQQRLLLELSLEALEDAGTTRKSLRGSQVGVFVGATWQDYARLATERVGAMGLHSATGQANSILANRLSYYYGLCGPSLVVDTACSSSLVAVHLACQSLWSGESEAALVAGVSLMVSPATMVALAKFGGVSEGAACRAFDAQADGFVRGEGGGLLVLKPLASAISAGDRIYCTLLGSAVNNDGATNGLTAPNPDAQANVISRALASARVAPDLVSYVEAHGAGTQLGDPIEAEALAAAYGERAGRGPLLVGSAKTNLGHLEAAAGVAGLIKTALAIQHRELPPSLHFERPNPHIPFDEWNLRVNTVLGSWDSPTGLRTAGVSSFGWGGTNCHVIVRESGDDRPVKPDQTSAPVLQGRAECGGSKLVYLCSPQGGQWSGMGKELLRTDRAFRSRVQRFDRAYRRYSGQSLLEWLVSGRADEPAASVEVVQPLVVLMELGVAASLEARGIVPDAVVGHSLGEIAAARLAGVFADDCTARLLFHYARLQATTDPSGTMAIASCDEAEVAALGCDVTIAGSNAPGSCLVSGRRPEIDEVVAELTSKGFFARNIDVNVAAHSPAMDPILAELERALEPIRPQMASVPLISTLFADWVGGEELGPAYWPRNLRSQVKFGDAVQRLLERGFDRMVEIGPSPILLPGVKHCPAWRGRGLELVAAVDREADDEACLGATAATLGAATKPLPRLAVCVPISAHNPEALRARVLGLAEQMRRRPDTSLADLAYTLAQHRDHGAYRACFVPDTMEGLVGSLERVGGNELPAQRAQADSGGVVLVFPGQGGQWEGMGRELMTTEPVFRDAMNRVSRCIKAEWGCDPRDKLMSSSNDDLRASHLAQPLVFAAQVALAELWRSFGIEASVVVGHSMGEVAAAHVAGILGLEDAVRIICRRSTLLARVSGRGAMLATELTLEQAYEVIAGQEHLVSVAVNNSPRSTVLSGDRAALEALRVAMEGQVFCRFVRVDVASHSPQVDSLLKELRDALAEIVPSPSRIPMVSTVTGTRVEGHELDAGYWVRNLRMPVRFGEVISSLRKERCRRFLEISPHPILGPAIEQCDVSGAGGMLVLGSTRRDEPEQAAILKSLSRLYEDGADVDWPQVQPLGGRTIPLPNYPFQRKHHWLPEATGVASGASANHHGHPLLGARIDLPPVDNGGPMPAALWRGVVSRDSSVFLGGHRLGGVPVVSAGASMELVAHAARELMGAAVTAAQFDFAEVLVLEAEQEVELQLLAHEDAGGRYRLSLHSRVRGAIGFRLHVQAHVQRAPARGRQVVGVMPDQTLPMAGPDELYRLLETRGASFDEALRGVANWQRVGERVFGTVKQSSSGQKGYALDPVCLDSCWQLLVAAVPEAAVGRCYIPTRVGEFWAVDGLAAAGELEVAVTRRAGSDAQDMILDVGLFDTHGRPLGEMRGVELREAALPRTFVDAGRDDEEAFVGALLAACDSGQERQDLLLDRARRELARVLDVESDEVGEDVNFKELGVTSLMGLEFRNRLESALQITLSAVVIWNYPTLERLVPLLARRMGVSLEDRRTEQSRECGSSVDQGAVVECAPGQGVLIEELSKLEALLEPEG